MDIPRILTITESAHRIHNPITPEKLATLGAALRLESGARVLDLGSGSGEMLCTWARDHGVIGTGIDMSQWFAEQARLRADVSRVRMPPFPPDERYDARFPEEGRRALVLPDTRPSLEICESSLAF